MSTLFDASHDTTIYLRSAPVLAAADEARSRELAELVRGRIGEGKRGGAAYPGVRNRCPGCGVPIQAESKTCRRCRKWRPAPDATEAVPPPVLELVQEEDLPELEAPLVREPAAAPVNPPEPRLTPAVPRARKPSARARTQSEELELARQETDAALRDVIQGTAAALLRWTLGS